MNETIPVLVTTKHRGVFFGYTYRDSVADQAIMLTNCRNCIYWSKDVGGFLGLASHGPTSGCRIGRLAPLPVWLHDITSVSQVTPEAAERWVNA